MAVLGGLIGESPGLVAVRTQVAQLLRQSGSRRLPPVLILGETGTGKGLLASAIHEAGPRAAGPFVAVNCAAIPETLLEAELFGFEQGAFTDARHPKAGLFQTANRGTLFLDEIGLMPQGLQVKLLTVLEDRTVRRLGGTRSEPVDVWIISATSENLRAGTRRRGFREELYHRLAVVTLHLPALRERGQDILTLAEHFLARICTEYGLASKTLTDDARTALLAYRWPGNVRELANLMERVALLTDARRVTAKSLELGVPRGRPASRSPDEDGSAARAPKATSLERAVREVEQARILEALHATRGNISHAADRLAVTRNILRYRLKKYGLQTSGTAERLTPEEPVSPPVAVEPAPAPRTAQVQWDCRHVALLRADLVPPSSVGVASHAGAVIETLVEKIFTFGGQVEEVSLLGLVAVFGLEPVEDAPRRAAHAALAMQKIVVHDQGRSAELPGVRVGLHVGQFLIARIGSTARLDHEAKREAWQQLEAFMGNAEAWTVLVSEAARPFLTRRFDLKPSTANEGTARRAYRLVGFERTGLGLGEQLTPFVGRGRELEQFAQALEQVQAAHGQVVGVVGEAGVGKSRLLWEFINSDRVRDSLILVSSAASYGKGTPYLPVIDLLKAYFRIGPRDDARKVRESVTEQVLSLEPAVGPALSALLALLGLHVADAKWLELDPQQKRRRTLEAVKLLLLEQSRRQPIILVFEDLHWVDSETQAVLDTLVESLPTHRVLLLISHRPEYQPTWSGKTYYAQLRLDPLSPEDARALLDRLVGGEAVTAALKKVLIERTGGNPFFLEESVRTLIETGILGGDGGDDRLALSAGEVRVPATVQAVLAARIDRLPPEDRKLLQAAAAIGRDVPFTLVRAVAELPEESLRAGVVRLQRSEFLYETRLVPELAYAFKHAVTHDVAYAGLLPDRRRVLHARIMGAIEQMHTNRLTEQVDRLAHHALRGEVWDKAVAYGREAAERAANLSAYRQAASCFDQALGALLHLPETRATIEQGIDLRVALRHSLFALGEPRRGFDHLREAEILAERIGDQGRLGWISAYTAAHFWIAGDPVRAVDPGQRALTVAQAQGDLRLKVVANMRLGQVYLSLGEFRRAREYFQNNIQYLKGDLIRENFGEGILPSVFTRVWLVHVLVECGEFAEGFAWGEEALQIAKTVNQPFSMLVAYRGLGYLHLRKGNLDEAIRGLERSGELSETWDIRPYIAGIVGYLGYAHVLSGRLAHGLSLLEQWSERTDLAGDRSGYAWSLATLAETYGLANRREDAIRTASQALDFARGHNRRPHEAWALRALGEIASHSDPRDAENAQVSYRQALALADELGMRPLVAHCHLGLGKLYGRTGKRQQAGHHLTTAATMYREMGMAYWLEKAEMETQGLA